MPDRDDINGGGGGGSLEDGDDYAKIDPTSIVVAFAITIALFPAIAANVVDPLLNQRTTLRDVLCLYRGLLLSAMIAVPVWVQLFADSDDRGGGGGGGGASSQRRGGQQRPAAFAALLCAIGVSWSTVVSAALGPPRYRLVRDPPGGSSSTSGGGEDRTAPPPPPHSSSSSSGVGAAGGVGRPPPSTRRRVRGYVE